MGMSIVQFSSTKHDNYACGGKNREGLHLEMGINLIMFHVEGFTLWAFWMGTCTLGGGEKAANWARRSRN